MKQDTATGTILDGSATACITTHPHYSRGSVMIPSLWSHLRLPVCGRGSEQHTMECCGNSYQNVAGIAYRVDFVD